MTPSSSRSLKFAAGATPALALVLALSVSAADRRPEFPDKTFGAPVAAVSDDEEYDGPPVVGQYVTMLPALAPLPPGNRTHDVRFDVITRELEIAPGVRFQAWTFGGSIPGPVLHVREGDRVRFTMKNRSFEEVSISPPARDASPFLSSLAARDPHKGAAAIMPMPHSMDFHAGTVAPNDKWRTIDPGQTIRFEWTANYPGVFIYHCGVAPVFQHMSMGQYGVVVVSPREGYPTDGKVDREYVLVQSEFYLKEGEDGTYGLDYEKALQKQPSHVAFNGHTTGLVQAPLQAEPGERVRLYVHNVGPTDTSSFHVIGTIFDRVWYEGNPANQMRGMQTVLLGASNGAVVELIVPEAGEYPFVDHEFADASRGALGKIKTSGPLAAGEAMHQH